MRLRIPNILEATPNVEAMDELASQLFAIDRKLEAVMWKSLEAHYRKLPPETMNHWNLERQQLVASGDQFPRPCEPNLWHELGRLSGSGFRASCEFGDDQSRPGNNGLRDNPHPASFPNVAEQIGLTHAYRVAPDDREFGFAMYQQAGGGVAVLDYRL